MINATGMQLSWLRQTVFSV